MRIGKKDIGAIAFFLALMIAFALLVNGITDKGGSQELEMVRDAVKNAALTCYAVEGAYPADLQYLRDHYRLSYNEDRYMVFYDAFASNLMPAIFGAERGTADL